MARTILLEPTAGDFREREGVDDGNTGVREPESRCEGLRGDWRNKCGDGSNAHASEVNPLNLTPPPGLEMLEGGQRTRDELMLTSRPAYLLMNEQERRRNGRR